MLCEGEGRLPVLRALEQGRLLDFFLLVRNVLSTYNPDGAHLPLSRWRGAPCTDCGDQRLFEVPRVTRPGDGRKPTTEQ